MYIPILKNRTIEISVLKGLIDIGLNNKVIPMLEVIQERSRSNSQKTYIEEIEEIFSGNNRMFFLDIPKINITGSTAEPVQTFMTMVNRQRNFFVEQLIACKNINGIIPVISYNPKDTTMDKVIQKDLAELRKFFKSVAIRVNPSQYNRLVGFIEDLLTNQDYLLFDIDDKGHTNPAFKTIYKSVNTQKRNIGFKSFIINSNRPSDMYNKNIVDGEPIEEIDNSLLEMYNIASYKFDGFGDYACVSNTLPSTGGAISPAGIFYSRDNNFFIGYKGRTPSLSEFSDYIAPEIIESEYWNEYDKKHHETCPGCRRILAVVNGDESGKSQALWKGITMSHYIFTVNEIMSKK